MSQIEAPVSTSDSPAPIRMVVRWLNRPFQIKPDPGAARVLTALLWACVTVTVFVMNVMAGYIHSPGEYVQHVYGTLCGVTVAWLLYKAFEQVVGRPSWLAFIAILSAVLVAGWLQMTLDYAGQFMIEPFDDQMVLPPDNWPARAKVALVYVCIYATNAALFWVTFANRQVRDQELLIAEQTAARLQSELRVLRLQLNPHFMFNALSALSSLIVSGRQAQADEMTHRLSDFLRAAIDIDAGEEIRLSEELSVLDAYLAVEATRFGDRMRLSIECEPEADDALVPNLLLQPLVENAIKYAVQPSARPVSVRVTARRQGDRLVLEVVDSGAGGGAALKPSSGHGVGLEATRSRLAISYGDRAMLTAGPFEEGFQVRIEMPFRPAPLS